MNMRIDFPTMQATTRLYILDVQQHLFCAAAFAIQPKARHGELAHSLTTSFNRLRGTLTHRGK
jgi:hypothetical protein